MGNIEDIIPKGVNTNPIRGDRPTDLKKTLASVTEREMAGIFEGVVFQKPEFSLNKTYELGETGVDRIFVRGIGHVVRYSIIVKLGGKEDVEMVVTEIELADLIAGKYDIDEFIKIRALVELKKNMVVRATMGNSILIGVISSNDGKKSLVVKGFFEKDKDKTPQKYYVKTKDVVEVVINKDGKPATERDIETGNI